MKWDVTSENELTKNCDFGICLSLCLRALALVETRCHVVSSFDEHPVSTWRASRSSMNEPGSDLLKPTNSHVKKLGNGFLRPSKSHAWAAQYIEPHRALRQLQLQTWLQSCDSLLVSGILLRYAQMTDPQNLWD